MTLSFSENTAVPSLVYLGLGSNLAEPVGQIKSACRAISALPDIQTIACSSLYRSLPMGPQDQPDYINAVMCVSTCLSPQALLRHLQTIEQAHGRERKGERWGARTLDVDILLYGEQLIDSPDLTVPHSGIAERSFVLLPLAEIAPQLVIPGKGTVTELLAHCPLLGLQRLN
ncbi:2-amino-4-hydroxy-6-hydroxymethyldihydropteridine diphosphokinase [Methylovulum psychrotolerans]|jgi:2-amino-4-hydroxy-6-hydroxymethyldihydropteridine diphosphokinase|uniref:2-amino-4-hydroxy-6-hydroxymethyldihydropteridine pyrophosphokinase n=1 Tax=Methylovulum psychrotolerans TaxID=1704499 RepID=A0A1Z4BX73_9GAMM|nr:2-amino-4-hydroxy-6-hydroxymethyldihydropteridine diphosphokinase [Methylovulum psychrotolerans]ASF45897.1 2-amino-4-hydroxy-6-hydroxymethyldihydropteridine diphosphokinase [Methylovulum psychrotolerans]MBT9097813.1 2-amino-4-hydroxy-6-hydroxymethyldihydropteridine diphosphokinase [Methylovulum psychrotolerans]POZ53363.1 2-amino-4-hydroxy-6- hydroxymethyldihydropteridine diphosphokinase [Methylovulum psychrotolerans]